ncbi:MAG: sterol desaturase family protein [Saprospiraceae bacterium]|nr:sterol desaturase family protein [Saprospiraceae bacterium]
MEAYAQVLNYAIPFFVILILIEALAAKWKGVQVNRGADTISSLSSGITNTIKDVLGLTVVIISYNFFVKHFAIFQIEETWALYVIGFIALDFAGYWMHRWNHTINFLWNRHIIHHSSEEFNLSCALRQSISVIFSFFNILLIPAALFGVPTHVIAIIAPLHLFAQFWYHTTLINKMGFLEYFLVTPSHHRVHHAMNEQYLDKNYGQIFIVWDRMFGTYQPELPEVPAVYGVKRPVKTWNPIIINWQHLGLLYLDAWRTKNWWDKLRIWFMPTGWRPADVVDKYPVASVQDVYNFQKYETHLSRPLLAWSWFQMIVTITLMFHLTNNIADLSFSHILLYGGFLFVCIFSYTTLMDKSKYTLWAEGVKAALGLGILWWQSGWFGLENFSVALTFVLAAYFLFSFAMVAVFMQREGQWVQAQV